MRVAHAKAAAASCGFSKVISGWKHGSTLKKTAIRDAVARPWQSPANALLPNRFNIDGHINFFANRRLPAINAPLCAVKGGLSFPA